MNNIYKLPIQARFSGTGALCEYYHFLIEFAPKVLYYCFPNHKISNINILVPKAGGFYLTHPKNSARTMAHLFQEIFEDKIKIVSLTDTSLTYPIIPFASNREDYWGDDNPMYYLNFQYFILTKYKIRQHIRTKQILIIRRGIQKGCEKAKLHTLQTGADRRHLPDKFFQDISIYLAKTKQNFQIVVLDNMSLLQQIELFYHSRLVIGIHGAGLSNIIFCQPETNVLELGEVLVPCYVNLAKKMNLKYYTKNTKKFSECQNILEELT